MIQIQQIQIQRRSATIAIDLNAEISPPLEECIFGHMSYPVFEAVGYGEIQRDTARYS